MSSVSPAHSTLGGGGASSADGGSGIMMTGDDQSSSPTSPQFEGFFKRTPQMAVGEVYKYLNEARQNEVTRDPVLLQTTVVEYHGEVMFTSAPPANFSTPTATNNGTASSGGASISTAAAAGSTPSKSHLAAISFAPSAVVDRNAVLNVPPVPAAAAAANAAILNGTATGGGGNNVGLSAGQLSVSAGAMSPPHSPSAYNLSHATSAATMSGANLVGRTATLSINNNNTNGGGGGSVSPSPSTTTTVAGISGGADGYGGTQSGLSISLGATSTTVGGGAAAGGAIGNVLTASPAPASILNHALFHGRGRLLSTLGYTYVGDFDRGLMHGNGRIVWADGTSYEGTFVDGVINGHGKYVWPNGDHYDGEVRNSVRHGKGKFFLKASGEVYDGEWFGGMRHGQGTLLYSAQNNSGGVGANNNTNMLHQHGSGSSNNNNNNGGASSSSSTSPSPNRVVGGRTSVSHLNRGGGSGGLQLSPASLNSGGGSPLSNNNISNNGGSPAKGGGTTSSVVVAVCKFVGSWDRDKKCGQGTMTYSNGDTYDGDWLNDLRHGKGVMTWRHNGGNPVEIYSGEWVEGVQEGYGESTYIRPTAAGALALASAVAAADQLNAAMNGSPLGGNNTAGGNIPKAPSSTTLRRMSQAGGGVLPAGGRPSASTMNARGTRTNTITAASSAARGGGGSGAFGGSVNVAGGILSSASGDNLPYLGSLHDPCGNLGTAAITSVTGAAAARDRALNTYAGEFVGGLREGFGVFIYDDGSTYEGMWRDNLKHGEGKLVSANGVAFVGIYERGIAVADADGNPLPGTNNNNDTTSRTQEGADGLINSTPNTPRGGANNNTFNGTVTSVVSNKTTKSGVTGATANNTANNSHNGTMTSTKGGKNAAAEANKKSADQTAGAADGTTAKNADDDVGANNTNNTATKGGRQLTTVVAAPIPLFIADIIGVGENNIPEAIAAVQTVASRHHSTLKRLFFYYSHLEKGGVEVVTVPNGTCATLTAASGCSYTSNGAASSASAGGKKGDSGEAASYGGGATAFRSRQGVTANTNGGEEDSNQPPRMKGFIAPPALPPPPPPPPISWKKGRIHGTMHILQLLRMLSDARILNQNVTIAVVDRIVATFRDVHTSTDAAAFGNIGMATTAGGNGKGGNGSDENTADGTVSVVVAGGGGINSAAKDAPLNGTLNSTVGTARKTGAAGGSTKTAATAPSSKMNSSRHVVAGGVSSSSLGSPTQTARSTAAGGASMTPNASPIKTTAANTPSRNTNANSTTNLLGRPTAAGASGGNSPMVGTPRGSNNNASYMIAVNNTSDAPPPLVGGNDNGSRAHSPTLTQIAGGIGGSGGTNATTNATFRQAWRQYRAHLHTLAVGELNYRDFIETLVRLSVKVFPADVYGSVARRFALLIEEYLSVFTAGGNNVNAASAAAAGMVAGGVTSPSSGAANLTSPSSTLLGAGGASINPSGALMTPTLSNHSLLAVNNNNAGGAGDATPNTAASLSPAAGVGNNAAVGGVKGPNPPVASAQLALPYRPQPICPLTSTESMRLLLWSTLPPNATTTLAKTYVVPPSLSSKELGVNTSDLMTGDANNTSDISTSVADLPAMRGTNATTSPMASKTGTAASGTRRLSMQSGAKPPIAGGSASAARNSAAAAAAAAAAAMGGGGVGGYGAGVAGGDALTIANGATPLTANTITAIPTPSTVVAELAARRYKGYTYLQVLEELFLHYTGRGTLLSSSEGIHGAGTNHGGVGPFVSTTTRKEQHLMHDRALQGLGLASANPMSAIYKKEGGDGGSGVTRDQLQQLSFNTSNNFYSNNQAAVSRSGQHTARPSLIPPPTAASEGGLTLFSTAGGGGSNTANRSLPPGHPLTLPPPAYAGRTMTVRQFLLFVKALGTAVIDPSLSAPPTPPPSMPASASGLAAVGAPSSASGNPSPAAGRVSASAATPSPQQQQYSNSMNNSIAATGMMDSLEESGASNNFFAAGGGNHLNSNKAATVNVNNYTADGVFIGRTAKSSGVVPKKKKISVIAALNNANSTATNGGTNTASSAADFGASGGASMSMASPPPVVINTNPDGTVSVSLTPKQAMADVTSLLASLSNGYYARFDRFPHITAAVLKKQQFAIAEQQRLELPSMKNSLSVSEYVKRQAAAMANNNTTALLQQQDNSSVGGIPTAVAGDLDTTTGTTAVPPSAHNNTMMNTTARTTSGSPTAAAGTTSAASALILTTVSEAVAHKNADAMFSAYQHLLKKSKGKSGVQNELDTLLVERELVFVEFVELVVAMGIAAVTARQGGGGNSGNSSMVNGRVGPPMLATTKVEQFFEKVLIPHHNAVW